jgi:hypothetical protein
MGSTWFEVAQDSQKSFDNEGRFAILEIQATSVL